MYTDFYTPKRLGSRVSQYFQTIAEFYFKFEDDSKNGGKIIINVCNLKFCYMDQQDDKETNLYHNLS